MNRILGRGLGASCSTFKGYAGDRFSQGEYAYHDHAFDRWDVRLSAAALVEDPLCLDEIRRLGRKINPVED
jgi:hypothetical protein